MVRNGKSHFIWLFKMYEDSLLIMITQHLKSLCIFCHLGLGKKLTNENPCDVEYTVEILLYCFRA